MRHPQEGAARLATEFSGGVPVLNAGDGANQHPTQTLLDLFTIQETQGRLENLNVAMVGDLKYGRTVHSLTQALAKFNGNRFYFIAPDALAMPQYILDMLDEKGIAWSLHNAIDDVMAEVDILYMTRVQKSVRIVGIRQRQSAVRPARRRPRRGARQHEGAAPAAAH